MPPPLFGRLGDSQSVVRASGPQRLPQRHQRSAATAFFCMQAEVVLCCRPGRLHSFRVNRECSHNAGECALCPLPHATMETELQSLGGVEVGRVRELAIRGSIHQGRRLAGRDLHPKKPMTGLRFWNDQSRMLLSMGGDLHPTVAP